MSRDELVEVGTQAMSSSLSLRARKVWVTRILDAVEPHIRADEQDEMLLRGWAPVEEHETLFAASVAARLVKVICDQEQRRVDLRAKVEALPETTYTYGDAPTVLRAEVLALLEGSFSGVSQGAGTSTKTETLADLRAKVEAIAIEHHYGGKHMWCVRRDSVLALFDGSK